MQESRNGSEPADTADGQTPFERFENLTRRLIRVPKHEVDEKRKQDKQPTRTRRKTNA